MSDKQTRGDVVKITAQKCSYNVFRRKYPKISAKWQQILEKVEEKLRWVEESSIPAHDAMSLGEWVPTVSSNAQTKA